MSSWFLIYKYTQVQQELLAEILMNVWGRKSLRSALNNFFISESKKALQKMIEACQKKKEINKPKRASLKGLPLTKSGSI